MKIFKTLFNVTTIVLTGLIMIGLFLLTDHTLNGFLLFTISCITTTITCFFLMGKLERKFWKEHAKVMDGNFIDGIRHAERIFRRELPHVGIQKVPMMNKMGDDIGTQTVSAAFEEAIRDEIEALSK